MLKSSAKNRSPDYVLGLLAAAPVFLGILVLASVSASFSMARFGTTSYYLTHQLLFGLLPGIALGLFCYFVPMERWRKWSFFLLAGNILLMFLVFAPMIGTKMGGAHRWISLGFLTFQPSELFKITSVLYISAWLTPRVSAIGTKIKTKRGAAVTRALSTWQETLLPFLVLIGLITGLLFLQKDLGTLGVIGLTALLVYFAAGTPAWHSMTMIFGSIGALGALIYLEPYRISRLAVFLNPMLDPLGKGFQAKQALIAIGSGGITGVGIGMSFQKFGVLPEPISDSIFAIFAEEAGFIGGLILVALFLGFALRGLMVVERNSDPFSRLVAVGIVSWITLQAFVNISSMIRLIPLTGVPLPFFSYGGTALMTELAGLGMLLNISKQRQA